MPFAKWRRKALFVVHPDRTKLPRPICDEVRAYIDKEQEKEEHKEKILEEFKQDLKKDRDKRDKERAESLNAPDWQLPIYRRLLKQLQFCGLYTQRSRYAEFIGFFVTQNKDIPNLFTPLVIEKLVSTKTGRDLVKISTYVPKRSKSSPCEIIKAPWKMQHTRVLLDKLGLPYCSWTQYRAIENFFGKLKSLSVLWDDGNWYEAKPQWKEDVGAIFRYLGKEEEKVIFTKDSLVGDEEGVYTCFSRALKPIKFKMKTTSRKRDRMENSEENTKRVKTDVHDLKSMDNADLFKLVYMKSLENKSKSTSQAHCLYFHFMVELESFKHILLSNETQEFLSFVERDMVAEWEKSGRTDSNSRNSGTFKKIASFSRHLEKHDGCIETNFKDFLIAYDQSPGAYK